MNTQEQARPATPEDIRTFCEALTEVTNAEYQRQGDTVNTAAFRPSPGGKKYVRIQHHSFVNGKACSGHSAHCFVKIDDGTLWKPAGYKGPAKNFPRGSVFDPPRTRYAGNS